MVHKSNFSIGSMLRLGFGFWWIFPPSKRNLCYCIFSLLLSLCCLPAGCFFLTSLSSLLFFPPLSPSSTSPEISCFHTWWCKWASLQQQPQWSYQYFNLQHLPHYSHLRSFSSPMYKVKKSFSVNKVGVSGRSRQYASTSAGLLYWRPIVQIWTPADVSV